MEIFNTILSHVLTGGISSGLSVLLCLKFARRKEAASAKDMEEQAESKSIQNEKEWITFYDILINDLTKRLENMMTKLSEAERRNNELEAINTKLDKKFNELEAKYVELEKKYNELKKM